MRIAFRQAREQHEGIYNAQAPLLLEPFEVRFLAQRHAPNRWVIDLGKSDSILVYPQNYFSVTNPEDRLFVPEEYVPLFVQKGWQLQSQAAQEWTSVKHRPGSVSRLVGKRIRRC